VVQLDFFMPYAEQLNGTRNCHLENDWLLQNPYNFEADNLSDVMQCKILNCSYLPNHPPCILIGHKNYQILPVKKKRQSISLQQASAALKSVLSLHDAKWSIQQ
jgi:hypothetical protein